MKQDMWTEDGGRTYNIKDTTGVVLNVAASEVGLEPPAPSPQATKVVEDYIRASQRPANPIPSPGQPVVSGATAALNDFVFPGRPAPYPTREFAGYPGDPTRVVVQRDGDGYRQVVDRAIHEVPGTASDARGGSRPAEPAPDNTNNPGLYGAGSPPPAAAAPGGAQSSMTASFAGFKPLANGFGETERAIKAQQDAQGEAGAVEARGQLEIQRLQQRQAEELRAQQVKDAERLAIQQTRRDEALQKYEGALKELEGPSGQVDRTRWWASRDTGQKVASFASAFLAGFAGGPNAIQQAIDADVDAQKYNFERADRAKAAKIQGYQSLYSMMRSKFDDENTAAAAAALGAQQVAAKEIESTISGIKGAGALPAAKLLQAHSAEKLAEKRTVYINAVNAQAAKAAEIQLVARAQGAAGPNVDAEGGQPVSLQTLGEKQRGRAVVVPNPTGDPRFDRMAVLALDEDSAKKLRPVVAGHATVTRVLDQMLALNREFGPELLDANAKKRAAALSAQFLLAVKSFENAGALDEQAERVVKALADDPLAFTRGIAAQLETAREGFDNKLADAWHTYTGNPLNARQAKVRQKPK